MNPKDIVGAKKAPLRYVPPAVMIEASGPMEDGALKYGPFNWRDQPVEVVTYVEAVLRHLYAFLDGQDYAEDSGHSHIGHAIAGLGIIADATANGTLIDNRYSKGPAADMLRDRDKSMAPKDAEPVVYSTRPGFTGRCSVCMLPDPMHDIDCPALPQNQPVVRDEEWGAGDGEVYRAVEQPDGCYEYRGVHVHPIQATEQTYRSIDKMIESRQSK